MRRETFNHAKRRSRNGVIGVSRTEEGYSDLAMHDEARAHLDENLTLGEQLRDFAKS